MSEGTQLGVLAVLFTCLLSHAPLFWLLKLWIKHRAEGELTLVSSCLRLNTKLLFLGRVAWSGSHHFDVSWRLLTAFDFRNAKEQVFHSFLASKLNSFVRNHSLFDRLHCTLFTALMIGHLHWAPNSHHWRLIFHHSLVNRHVVLGVGDNGLLLWLVHSDVQRVVDIPRRQPAHSRSRWQAVLVSKATGYSTHHAWWPDVSTCHLLLSLEDTATEEVVFCCIVHFLTALLYQLWTVDRFYEFVILQSVTGRRSCVLLPDVTSEFGISIILLSS